MAKENDATFVLNVPEQEAVAMASPQWESIANFDATIVPASHKKLLRSMAHAKGNQISVFPEDIRIIPGFNPRLPTPEFQAHIREIADSIKEHGFYEDKPLAGFAGMDGTKPVFFLTDGEVRYRAALIARDEGAPLEVLPAVLKREGTSLDDLTVALVRSNGGKRFTPLELSIVCARLSKFNWETPKIAKALGISGEYVSQLLLLASAPKPVRDMVQAGDTSAGVAITALKNHGADAQKVIEQAANTAKAQGKTSVSKRHLPEEIHKKAVRKAAPVLLDALTSIQAHKDFEAMPEDLRQLVDNALRQIDSAQESAKPKRKQPQKAPRAARTSRKSTE